jgi:hypothetical protein
MKEFLDSFSNREISIVFWTMLIVLTLICLNLSGLINLVKAFFAKKLFLIYFLMFLQLGSIIYFLNFFGLWETSLYKDFIFWLISSAFVMLLSFDKLKSTKDFKNILLKLITINVVLEFVANNYNFSLLKELLLIPFVSFVSILLVVAQQKMEENEKVIKFFNLILTYIGFGIIVYVIYRLIISPYELLSIINLKSFLLTPIFTILFIPFVFLLVIYSKYEHIFMNLNRYKFLTKERKTEIKLAIIQYGNLKLEYLNNAHSITIWRKAELQNEVNVKSYIKDEIKKDVKLKE